MHHSQHAKNHEVTVKIQQSLGSHQLNSYTHFWPCPPKNHWNNFLLSWIWTIMQKTNSFHLFILEMQSVLGSHDQTGRDHFWLCPTKKILNNSYFMWICIKIQKIRLFHWFLLEILSINKILQPDWLGIFWPISPGETFSQIGDLCRNTENNIYFHYRTISVNINTNFFNKF